MNKYPYSEITRRIIKCFFEVHNILGPGFLEQPYKNALMREFVENNLKCEAEKEIYIYYKGHLINYHRLDLIIEDKVIIEVKTVDAFHPMHEAQIIAYLKASGKEIGLLVNFARESLKFKRYIFSLNH